MVRPLAFDHLVLVVADVRRSIDWYCDKLGLTPERVDEWERGDVFFPSVRVDEGTVIDLLAGTPSGTNVDHLCLVVADADVDEVVADPELVVVDGPDLRWGARGTARSVYVRDPDGNLVELRAYPG